MVIQTIFGRYRWAYYLLLIILGIQSFLLLQNDPRFILILGAALIPGILYLSYVRNSDVGGKEPRGVIALHMILGILIIYPAIFLVEASYMDKASLWSWICAWVRF